VGHETAERGSALGLDERDRAAYDELRTGFTAAVSHELRTPLARLLALLESMLLPGAQQEQLVEQARVEVEHARELIDDILFLSELESGATDVSVDSTPAVPLVRTVLERLEESAARAGVALRAEGDDHVELPVRARMLRVIVENLAENAIRHAGPGATFTLAAAQENGTLVLSAADDGTGVSEQDLPRLFERFYRGDRARASRGSGLGLSIVKHIVASAGGQVQASGQRGRGLEIRCTFPAVE